MHRVMFTIAMLVMFALSPPSAGACSCIPDLSPLSKRVKRQFQEAEAVFVAKVVESTPEYVESTAFFLRDGTAFSWASVNRFRIRLEVKEVFKGQLRSEVLTTTGPGAGVCSWGEMHAEREYLIYASSAKDGTVHFGMCGGTTMIWTPEDPSEWMQKQEQELKQLRKLARKQSRRS